MRRKRTGSEVSNWWFNDEDLLEAINNIVDVPPKPKKPRKPAPRDAQDNTQHITEVSRGNKE